MKHEHFSATFCKHTETVIPNRPCFANHRVIHSAVVANHFCYVPIPTMLWDHCSCYGRNRKWMRSMVKQTRKKRLTLGCITVSDWLMIHILIKWVYNSHMLHVWYIYLQHWVIFRVNVGKYTIHGAFGLWKIQVFMPNMHFSTHQSKHPI